MKRRDVLRAALVLASAPLAGCPLSFEQGLFNDCRSPHPELPGRQLVEAAWQGLRPGDMWDVHAHLFGNGRGGSGIWLDPDLDQPRTLMGRARRVFFMNAGCAGEDDGRLDDAIVARMTELVEAMPAGAKLMLLAFDFTYDEAGQLRRDLTTFAVPNEYARRVAAARRDRFEWIASVHPYRPDALEALEAAKSGGARAVKWLPPTMGIDPGAARCRPFYDALRRLELPLLVHVGEEQAALGALRAEYANPLHLRQPLEQGVRVIAAHCATLGESPDLDAVKNPGKAPRVANFELFARLMGERRYERHLFADISAVTQLNRAVHLPVLLQRREWHPRLLNGSDYPLPGVMPIFSLKSLVSIGVLDEALVPALRELRETNALLFDFALKRHLRFRGARFAAGIFQTRPFFERA